MKDDAVYLRHIKECIRRIEEDEVHGERRVYTAFLSTKSTARRAYFAEVASATKAESRSEMLIPPADPSPGRRTPRLQFRNKFRIRNPNVPNPGCSGGSASMGKRTPITRDRL